MIGPEEITGSEEQKIIAFLEGLKKEIEDSNEPDQGKKLEWIFGKLADEGFTEISLEQAKNILPEDLYKEISEKCREMNNNGDSEIVIAIKKIKEDFDWLHNQINQPLIETGNPKFPYRTWFLPQKMAETLEVTENEMFLSFSGDDIYSIAVFMDVYEKVSKTLGHPELSMYGPLSEFFIKMIRRNIAEVFPK